MQMKFMIKYGKAEHLQQIVDGNIRFTPPQKYIDIEEQQQLRGQGDRLEGKMELSPGKIVLNDIDTGSSFYTIDKAIGIGSIDGVSKMLLSCFAAYDEKYICDYVDENEYKILLPNEVQDCIKSDFPEASHALIILEPNKFIQHVCNIENHRIIGDYVKYFRRDDLAKYMYWATGETTIKPGKHILYGKDKYRFLLTKDKSLEKQCEYRFICLDNVSDNPVQYSFDFSSKYMLVPIEILENAVQVNLKADM